METKSENVIKLGLEKQVKPIERVDISSVTPEIFFEKYQKTGTPIIITGLLESEGDWNLDYLCEKFGSQELIFRNPGREREKQEKRKWKSIGSGVNLQSMPFTEYAEMLRNHKAHENDINLGKCPLKNTPLANTQSLKIIGSRLGLTKPASELNIYVAPGGHRSGLHYDSVDGTLMQLHGAKKIVFFPPSETYNLYPFPVYIHLRHGLKLRSWFSQVDLENPDFKTMPKFKQALQHKCEVILEQGETLYIPAGWWHEVIGLGDEMVCAVNRFWRIYPTSRAVFSWSRWRAACGIIFALPYTFLNFAIALGSSNRKQKISKISHRI
ncbi:cupin-like domain-containing protein [Trichocoleus sp. DQ-A3]|uniref:cupin-like domain-containing protein n=1 Tax=Cyanophyceae TaxID=3028117 RepID=UPI0016881B71|nr:cupin-like domain-containing protein [Coleofasciculus sp. FACHB-125]MBD1902442.1 cupin-like domain-containing protein [Coleofasciculus sp. FACHB-125]